MSSRAFQLDRIEQWAEADHPHREIARPFAALLLRELLDRFACGVVVADELDGGVDVLAPTAGLERDAYRRDAEHAGHDRVRAFFSGLRAHLALQAIAQ